MRLHEVKEHGQDREEIKQANTKDDFLELSNNAGNHISYCVFDYFLKKEKQWLSLKTP